MNTNLFNLFEIDNSLEIDILKQTNLCFVSFHYSLENENNYSLKNVSKLEIDFFEEHFNVEKIKKLINILN